jgi:pre-mRNA-splicing factor 38B
MLKDQILGSSYFKSLLSITGIDELIEEIEKYADTMDVYNGNSTASPSCFICQVYRLFTLPEAEDIDEALVPFIDHTSTVVRCAGFVYMRLVVPPPQLWDKLEEYLFDTMELTYVENGQTINTTIGLFVEGLLGKVKYFGMPLPRIPVKVHQRLERELAPMWQYRKRMEANHRTLGKKRITDLPVEVCIDGEWLRGTAKEYSGKIFQKRKARVELEDGQAVSVHLGKVVLRDGSARSESEDSGEEGNKRKRRRRSPDWSRYKGRSEKEMTAEFRDKWKEEAVCTTGKSYSRRPFTMEEELWRREPEARVSMLGEDERAASSRRQRQEEDSAIASAVAQKLKRDEELERMNKMRAIYEKYGASSAAKKSSSVGDVDKPDVLRLG